MPPKRSRKAKGLPPKRKDPGSSMKHSIALRPKYVRRNAKVADDAISEASDQTKYDLNYETVLEDEVEVSDQQGSSVFEVPLSPPQKRLRPDDIASSLDELFVQQIASEKAQQLNGERIKAFFSTVPLQPATSLRNKSLSRIFDMRIFRIFSYTNRTFFYSQTVVPSGCWLYRWLCKMLQESLSTAITTRLIRSFEKEYFLQTECTIYPIQK